MPPQSENNQNPYQPNPQQPDAGQMPVGDTGNQVGDSASFAAPSPVNQSSFAPPANPGDGTPPIGSTATPQVFGPSWAPQPTVTPTPPTPSAYTPPAELPAAGQPQVGQSFGGGGGTYGGPATYGSPPAMAGAAASTGKAKRLMPMKMLMLVGAAVVVLGGGSAAAYFGYYMSPGTVWKDSLSNTGKGYDQLVSYLNTQSATHYSGYKEDGTFQVNAGGANYDGSLSAQSYGSNSTGSLKVDLGVTKLDVETRSVVAAGASEPDLYLQVSGIKDFTDFLGPDLGPKVANLDGQWIVVDHNLVTDLQQQLLNSQAAKANPQLKWADVNAFLVSAGHINQKYVFTTNKQNSVTTIVKNYGKETVDGHKTMHYKVGFVKANVKAYVTAMCDALSQGGLGTYLKQFTGNQAVSASSACTDAEKSTDNIKSTDTVDVWADISHRMLYKVRISDLTTSNPAENFVDLGLNYTGGDTYPFFISGQDNSNGNNDTYSVVATLDSKTNSIKAVVKANSKGDSPMSLNGNFTLAPSNQKLTITAPANAKSVTDVINSLGLGDLFSGLTSPSTDGNILQSDSTFSTPTISL